MGDADGELKPYRLISLRIMKVDEELRGASGAILSRPKPRSGHRVVCDDGQMYVFGGFNPAISANDPDLEDDDLWRDSRPVFRDLWIFSFARKRWRKVQMHGPVPQAAVSHGLVKRGHYLLCYGGSGKNFGQSSSNTLTVFNLITNTWSVVPTVGDIPEAMYGQGVTLKGHLLYSLGGTTGNMYSNDVHVMNLNTSVWRRLSNSYGDHYIPDPRYRHEIVWHEHKLWVFGGGTAEDTFDMTSIPAFNLVTNKWECIQSNPDPLTKRFPLSRKCHALVKYDDQVFISGGCDAERVRFTMIWRFNLTTATWTEMKDSVPHGLYFHSACVTPAGKMYIFGGVMEHGMDQENPRTDVLFSMWLRVPSLREMCFETLVETQGKPLATLSRKALHATGIPPDMAARFHPRAHQPAVG